MIQIIVDDLGDDWTLDEYAEFVLDDLEQQADAEAWEVFELMDFGKDNDGERDYYYLTYQWQLPSEEHCAQFGLTNVFLSDFYPSEPYSFVLEAGLCEDVLEMYGEEVAVMLDSFMP